MQAKNKWNGRIYNVIEIKDNEVTLERTEDYCEKKNFKNSVAMASMAIIKRSFESHLIANDFPATSEYDEFYSHSDNN